MRKTVFGMSKVTGLLAVMLIPLGCGGGDGPGGTAVEPAATGGVKGGAGSAGGGGARGSGGAGPGGGSNPAGGANGSAGATGTAGTSGGGKGGKDGSTGGSPGPAADGGSAPGGSSAGEDGGAPSSGPSTPGGPCAYQDDKQFCACLAKSCGGDTFADKDKMNHPVYCGTCAGPMVCVAQATVAGGAAGQCQAAAAGLTDGQKKVSAALTSLWENSSSTIQYGYCQDIGDNRGFTAGRAGFCSGTGDAIVVVKCLADAKPGNALEKFLAPLTALEAKFLAANGDFEKAKSGDTSTLGGYCAAWKGLGGDPAFRACQDASVDSIYYGAALQHAAERKLTTALTKISLWDGQIMHGEADQAFGMRKQLAMADAMVKLSAAPTREEENNWLGAFHTIRAKIMTTRNEWRGNIYRVALYERLRRAGNFDVTGCVNTAGAKASDYWPGLPGNTAPSANVCP